MAKTTKKKVTKKKASTRGGKKVAASKKVTKKKAVTKKVAKKKPTKKKAAKKKPVAKKTTKKKTVKKKAPAKKAVTKKTTQKKTAKKKTVKKKPAAKKVVKKAASKKVTKKKVTKKKVASKKKAPAKKAASSRKRSSARRAVPYAQITGPINGHAQFDQEPPTKAQLKKVKTSLKRKDINFFRKELLERRAEIIGDVQGLEASRGGSGDISHMPLHMADVGSDNYEQEFNLGLMESERKIIIEIDEALQRMGDGIYGVCLVSAKPIRRARLEAKPWAKYTIDVARAREQRGR